MAKVLSQLSSFLKVWPILLQILSEQLLKLKDKYEYTVNSVYNAL